MNFNLQFNELIEKIRNIPERKLIAIGAIALGIILILTAVILML